MLLLSNLAASVFVILGVVVAALTVPDSKAKRRSIIGALVLGVPWLALTIYIYEQTPGNPSYVSNAVCLVAQSEVFHLIVALCIGAVGGWLLHSRFGRGKVVAAKQASELDWKSSYDVLDLANARKMNVWREVGVKLVEMADRIVALQLNIDAREERHSQPPLEQLMDGPDIATMTTERIRLLAEHLTEKRANDALYHDIVSDLHSKLRSGELVAQGFMAPVSKDFPESIPTTLWQLLKLNDDFTSAYGHSKSFVGVQIAQAQNRTQMMPVSRQTRTLFSP